MTAISLKREEGQESSDTATETITVWDPVVRLFHWTIVAACMLNLFFLEEGKYWHRVTGYVVAAAIVIRLLWGFIGTRHARFSDFLPTPRRVMEQILDMIDGSERCYLGHNPLASVMMLRKKLAGYLTKALIETVRGVSYMMREARA